MRRTCYVAGPMRSIERFNFPAFDRAAELLRSIGHAVVSPAELDREAGVDEFSKDEPDLRRCMRRDLNAILNYCDTIALLPGWQKSRGCAVEVALGLFLGLKFIDAITLEDIEL